MARERVEMPPGAVSALARMHADRMAIERRALAEFKAKMRDAAKHARDLVLGNAPAAPWTIHAHARAMRDLRAVGQGLGRNLSAIAQTSALRAAEAGAERYPKALAAMASGALGRRVPAPAIDLHRADSQARVIVFARTDAVGGRSGEDIGQALVAASFVETRRKEPPTAAIVAAAIAALLLRRGESNGDRVLVTEVTAGYGIGARFAGVQLQELMPRLMKVFDATLDLRVCAICAGLHHVMVPENENFPGGYESEPIHGHCRCATMPWLEDWNDIMDAVDVGPGVRTGVQEGVEIRLPSFSSPSPYTMVK